MASQASNTTATSESAVIESAPGADLLIGTAGADVFHIGSVEASSKAGQDTIEGFCAGDRVSFDGITLQGDSAPATLHWAGVEPDNGKAYGVWQWADGTLRADINGDSAADISLDMQGVILGEGDFQFGQDADTPIEPEPTARLIESGRGADLLIGAAGVDVFHIGSVEASSKAGQDTIEGFGAGDLVSFDGIILQGDSPPATLHWAGVEPDNGKAYGVWQWADGTLRADINGDSSADISLDMQGVILGEGDFRLGAGNSTPDQPAEPELPIEPEIPVEPRNPDLPATQLSWVESFDNGLGMFSRAWGPGVDTSIPGQLTIWTSADNLDSGAMVPPWGNPDAGYGYGLYSFTLETKGVIGIYALTWPATDVWPGPELDLLEIDSGGNGYSAIHYKDANGGNGYDVYGWGNLDLTQVHTFSMLWEEGRLTGFVDGEARWTTTDNVPRDYAHGGENTAPGIGTQTWWNDGAMGGNNSITLYEASYSVIA